MLFASRQTGAAPEQPLRGMGLLNIYARLRLLYDDGAVFNASAAPEGGACVEIGGRAEH
jgi:two-component system sensor histidine kinase YesM